MTTRRSRCRPRGLASSLLALAFLLTGGCGDSGGGGGGGDSDGLPVAPTIISFAAVRDLVTAGTGTTLAAVFSGGTGSVSNGVGAITSGVPMSTGILGTSTTFVLTVTSSTGATATSTVTVNVVPAPRILSFAANPTAVAPGEAATLTAVFENGVGSVDQGIGSITSGVGVGTGAMSATAKYRLTVTNAALDSVTSDVTVTVTRFRITGSMAVPRSGHTATLLQDGRVLVAGGDALGSAELYDPATGTFAVTGSMNVARWDGHAAARLKDGRVLVTGGNNPGGREGQFSAELYDPATGSFTPTGPMLHPRERHTATTLPDGKVLIVGGCCWSTGVATYVDDEIYDPMTGTFAAASPRFHDAGKNVFSPAAIVLTTGDILIAGGLTSLGTGTATATVYNASSGLFTQVGSMNIARQHPLAARLSDGRVLVVGYPDRDDVFPWEYEWEAELFDPVTATFALTAEPQVLEPGSATALPDGTVLVTNGAGLAEQYDPGTGTFKAEGPMRLPRRDGYTATQLLTGEVLFVGGTPDGVTATSSAELFR